MKNAHAKATEAAQKAKEESEPPVKLKWKRDNEEQEISQAELLEMEKQ